MDEDAMFGDVGDGENQQKPDKLETGRRRSKTLFQLNTSAKQPRRRSVSYSEGSKIVDRVEILENEAPQVSGDHFLFVISSHVRMFSVSVTLSLIGWKHFMIELFQSMRENVMSSLIGWGPSDDTWGNRRETEIDWLLLKIHNLSHCGPSHYLNQCWFIMNVVVCVIHLRTSSQEVLHVTFCKIALRIALRKLLLHLPGAIELVAYDTYGCRPLSQLAASSLHYSDVIMNAKGQ